MNREERQILKLSGIYTVIALALFALFWMPFALAQTQTGYCPYDPKIVPPKNLGEFSRTFGTFIAEVGTDGTFYIPVGTTAVTGSGTTGRIGTTTARDLSLPMFGWNGTAWVFKAQGSTTPWSALTTIGSDFVTKWKVGSDEGTGTQRFVAGTGISLVGTCTDGVGTITINAVGTSSAGGWLDTGTQTVASSGYLVRLQGQLILHPDGISGLVDSMIPNTITLDNITQVTSRALSDMQGTVNDSQVDNNITLDNITQITNRSLADMQGLLDLGTQSTGGVELGTRTTGNYVKDWKVGSILGTGSVNFVTSNYATSSATFSAGNGTITFKTLTRNQVFTSSGSFSVPSDTNQVLVTCLGGGAGGSSGEGGGAGGLVWQFPMTVTPSGTVTVSIGAAGTNNVNGGNTSFGTLTAYGGTSGGAGGYSSVNSAITTDAGDSSAGNSGGAGGHSNWGQGGNGGSNAQVGFTGSGYGSGGGGGGFSGAWYAGGTGTAGLCIVNF